MSTTNNSLKRLQYRAFGRLVLQRIGDLNNLIIECMEALEEPEVENPYPSPEMDLLMEFAGTANAMATPPGSPEIIPTTSLPPSISSATTLSPVQEEEGDIVIAYHTPLFYGDDGVDDDETLGSQDTYSVATDPEQPDEYDLEDPFIDDSQGLLE